MAYRVRQALDVRRLRGGVHAGKIPVSLPPVEAAAFDSLQMPAFDMAAQDPVIDNILGGMVFTLNAEREKLALFERGTQAKYFADIRLTTSTPDIRAVWEPGRLQHLTILFVHAKRNADPAGIGAIQNSAKDSLLAWIRSNPFLTGPHYMSPMECGLRMPVFFYSLKRLDNLTPGERREILEALYMHAWWVSRNLSLYSSLGNHTICECIGLVFAGAVFRGVPEGKAWLEKGVELLRQELHHQIVDDGGPAEQSLSYHRFVLDLYWLAVDFLGRNGLTDCEDWRPRLELGEQFLATFRDESDATPAIGDSDDGFAIAPGIYPKRLWGKA
jgi:hypothetical protein